MPAIVGSFSASVDGALLLANKAEAIRVELLRLHSATRLPEAELISLYEAAFLRVFVAWEDFLDRAFVNYLCGRRSGSGLESLTPGQSYSKTLADAELRVYGSSSYALWHNPQKVVHRAKRFFSGGLIENVVSSDLSKLSHYAAVRHRIAHGHSDSKAKFDSATMALCGVRFRAGRPGRFLRETVTGLAQPTRWIEYIGDGLKQLAAQIVP